MSDFLSSHPLYRTAFAPKGLEYKAYRLEGHCDLHFMMRARSQANQTLTASATKLSSLGWSKIQRGHIARKYSDSLGLYPSGSQVGFTTCTALSEEMMYTGSGCLNCPVSVNLPWAAHAHGQAYAKRNKTCLRVMDLWIRPRKKSCR